MRYGRESCLEEPVSGCHRGEDSCGRSQTIWSQAVLKAATFPMHGYTSHFQVSGFKLGREGRITSASNPCRTVHPFLFLSWSVNLWYRVPEFSSKSRHQIALDKTPVAKMYVYDGGSLCLRRCKKGMALAKYKIKQVIQNNK